MISDEIYARISEDEAAARAACLPDGTEAVWKMYDHPSSSVIVREVLSGDPVVYNEGSPVENEAAHIARFDPARMLREARALRKLLARVDLAVEESDAVDNIRLDCYLAEELRGILAEIWEG